MLSRTLFSFSFGFSFLSLPFTTARLGYDEWKKSDGCYKLQNETFLADATEVDDSNVKSVLFSTFFDTIQEDPKIKHELFLPPNYNPENAYPVMFHFHGYGGSYHECGSTCVKAAEERGFVVVSMTGFGPTVDGSPWSSWRVDGNEGVGPFGPICDVEQQADYCLQGSFDDSGCDCAKENVCTWTTCFDSVHQFLKVLEKVKNEVCVDVTQVWATGCSTGGIFTFTLAADKRSAQVLAGIVPIVGLPHYGHSKGPKVKMPMIGFYGDSDPTIPAYNNEPPPYSKGSYDPAYPNRTRSWDGDYFYLTPAEEVVKDWTASNRCEAEGITPLENGYGIEDVYESLNLTQAPNHQLMSCTQGCSERIDHHVVSCIFKGGHICGTEYGYRADIWEPAFNFMLTPRNERMEGFLPLSVIPIDEDIYVPVGGYCIRIRLKSGAKLVGNKYDPNCLYSPPGSENSPPPGYRRKWTLITEFHERIDNTAYFQKLNTRKGKFNNKFWHGTVTFVSSGTHSVPTVTMEDINKRSREFDLEISL